MAERTTIDVAATISGLASLLTTFRSFLTYAGVPASIQRNVHAAVDELVANIIEHGTAVPAHAVTMHVECDDERVCVELVDNGIAFDPVHHVPEAPLELQLGGIGIRLAHHWVDEAHYERRDGANHLVLVKRR